MKKPLAAFLGLLFASNCWAQSSPATDYSYQNQEYPAYPEYYSTTFQDEGFGAMDENGVSIEKDITLSKSLASPSHVMALGQEHSSKAVVVINKTSNIRTKMYYWTDAKGVVHYSDSASAAPKGAKSKMVVAVRPRHITPPMDIEPATPSPLPASNSIPLPPPSDAAPPPTGLPPSQLPPIPPSFSSGY